MADWRAKAADLAKGTWLTYPRTRGMDRDEVWLAIIDVVAPTIRGPEGHPAKEDPVTPSDAQVERGAQALRDDTAYASSYARKVLTPVLSDLKSEILALEPDESGRISKGLVLAYILGELP